MNNNILSYFRELSIVIVGISIAFAINKWSENRKADIREKNVLENIILDLEGNNFQINGAKKSNELMIAQYDSLLDILINNNARETSISFFVTKVVIASTSLELAISLGVLSDIDYELARDISFCFKLQSDILEFEKSFMDYIEASESDRIRYYTKSRVKLLNYNNAIISLDQTQEKLISDIKLSLGK